MLLTLCQQVNFLPNSETHLTPYKIPRIANQVSASTSKESRQKACSGSLNKINFCGSVPLFPHTVPPLSHPLVLRWKSSLAVNLQVSQISLSFTTRTHNTMRFPTLGLKKQAEPNCGNCLCYPSTWHVVAQQTSLKSTESRY